MIEVHAAVEQFATALDDMTFESSILFDAIRPDVRLSLLLRALAARGDDFVRFEKLRRRQTALPGPRLRQDEHRWYPLPFRTVASFRRTRSPSVFALIEQYMQVFRSMSAEQIESAVDLSRKMIAPACNGELIAEQWNRDGQLMFTVTEQGAPKYGVPSGTDDLMSVIGFQRTGSGQGYSPITLRFSFSDEAD